jgi:hypothetical protein
LSIRGCSLSCGYVRPGRHAVGHSPAGHRPHDGSCVASPRPGTARPRGGPGAALDATGSRLRAALRPGRRVVALREVEGMPRLPAHPPGAAGVPGSAISETRPPGEGEHFRVKGDTPSRVLTAGAVVCSLICTRRFAVLSQAALQAQVGPPRAAPVAVRHHPSWSASPSTSPRRAGTLFFETVDRYVVESDVVRRPTQVSRISSRSPSSSPRCLRRLSAGERDHRIGDWSGSFEWLEVAGVRAPGLRRRPARRPAPPGP